MPANHLTDFAKFLKDRRALAAQCEGFSYKGSLAETTG
jgi:hypothetical protein